MELLFYLCCAAVAPSISLSPVRFAAHPKHLLDPPTFSSGSVYLAYPVVRSVHSNHPKRGGAQLQQLCVLCVCVCERERDVSAVAVYLHRFSL